MWSVNQMKGSWTASKMESERNVLIGNCHDVKTWLGISKISFFGCLKSHGSLNKSFFWRLQAFDRKKTRWPSNTTGNYLFENIVQWEYLLGQRVSNQFKLQFVVKKHSLMSFWFETKSRTIAQPFQIAKLALKILTTRLDNWMKVIAFRTVYAILMKLNGNSKSNKNV